VRPIAGRIRAEDRRRQKVAKRTLIVSPDPGLVQQTRGVLEARGVDVKSVAGSEAARDVAREGPLDLVIAEVDLPGGSGYELCRLLKASADPPKVMLLFTAGEGSAERNAAECGADAAVRRPFLTSQFLEQLVPMVGPAFFGIQSVSVDSVDSIDPEDRNPGSIIDPGTGIFSDGVSVLDSGDYNALATGDVEALNGPQTQELPPLNIEPFDEENPVSVPVSASATAHAMPVVSQSTRSVDIEIEDEDDSYVSQEVDAADQSDDDDVPDPFSTSRVSSLGRATGEAAAVAVDADPSVKEAARVRRAVDSHLDELLEPGGRLATLLEDTVSRAVSDALAQAIPAATEAAARLLGKVDDD